MESYPDMSKSHSDRINDVRRLGRLDEALDKPTAATPHSPQAAASAYFEIASLHYQRKNNKLALEAVRDAIKRKPDFALAYVLLGVILRELGQVDAAVDAC